MKIDHDTEIAEAQRLISSLRADCQSQRERIDVLDGLVHQLRGQAGYYTREQIKKLQQSDFGLFCYRFNAENNIKSFLVWHVAESKEIVF